MERLTEKLRDALENTISCLSEVQETTIERALEKLAAYEDTGLEPEDIAEVKDCVNPIPFGRFHEIMEAEQDGRLVVLSIPMVPLVSGDNPMDTDVYCPRCGNTLSGGWPAYHTDYEWKLCQCPNCGQSIDDCRVISREEAEKALGEEE